jgi:hypothetical protein
MIFRFSRQTRGLVLTLATLSFILVSLDAFAFPSARRNPGMAWSGEAGGVILFGGLSSADVADLRYEYGDTWKWSGLRWVRLYPDNEPEARTAMAMVYDSNRERIVMFGGSRGQTLLGDTWVFRGGNWSRLEPPNAPPGRRFSGAAFDPLRDRVVLFGGGLGTDARFFDTWEFDGTTWHLMQSEGPEVESPSLVYDRARSEILMLGMLSDEPAMYRYDAPGWTRIEVETLPSCVGQGSMTFLDHDQRVVFYDGLCVPRVHSNKTWLWDGTEWTEKSVLWTAGNVFGFGLAYDGDRKQAVLYGGVDGFIGFREQHATYKLTSDRWLRMETMLDPGPRTQFVFQADEKRGTTWFFGGQNSVEFFEDFWRLDDLKWAKVEPDERPILCGLPVGSFDLQRDRLVVLCANSSTWEFDGVTWEAKDPVNRPPQRSWSMMVYDRNLRKVVLYGGYDPSGQYLDQTWTWDGTNWVRLDIRSRERPRARALAQMFWDPESSRIILHGGVGFPSFRDPFQRYGDQWYFDGTKWVEMSPSTKLPHRYGAQIATDPRTGRILVFGGKNAQEKYINELWTWDGNAWSEVSTGDAPAPRMNGRMVLDPSTGKVVLYGGFAGLYYSELWTFDGSWTRIEEEPPVRRRPTRPGSGSSLGSSEAGLVSLDDATFDGSGTRIEDDPPMRRHPTESGFNPLLGLPDAGRAVLDDAVR